MINKVFLVKEGEKRVFEYPVLLALSKLLPKTCDLDNPPNFPLKNQEEYVKYAIAICSFLLNYEEVIREALGQIVKLPEKLGNIF